MQPDKQHLATVSRSNPRKYASGLGAGQLLRTIFRQSPRDALEAVLSAQQQHDAAEEQFLAIVGARILRNAPAGFSVALGLPAERMPNAPAVRSHL
jgi:hypothetical protein